MIRADEVSNHVIPRLRQCLVGNKPWISNQIIERCRTMENKGIKLTENDLNSVSGGQSHNTYVLNGIIYTRLYEDCAGLSAGNCKSCVHAKECTDSCLRLDNEPGGNTEAHYDQSKKC